VAAFRREMPQLHVIGSNAHAYDRA
jgi:hypothetical protein